MVRDYKDEYRKFHKSIWDKLNRAARNKANRKAKKAGQIRAGDGNHVDHVVPLKKGGSRNGRTRVMDGNANQRKGPR